MLNLKCLTDQDCTEIKERWLILLASFPAANAVSNASVETTVNAMEWTSAMMLMDVVYVLVLVVMDPLVSVRRSPAPVL